MRFPVLSSVMIGPAFLLALSLTAAVPGRTAARGPDRIYTIQPPNIFRENIGLLDMMVTNLGVFGNPGFVDQYGARWRGNEYLYAGGLWIGAIASDNLPYVSTALYDYELRPSLDPVDTIYPTHEGAPQGNRIGFSRQPDDDGDGLIDEDFLNGKDDDGDGRIDEDFAAISGQMLNCEYWDYTPEAQQQYPEHRPLNLLVRQRTFGWSAAYANEFVGVEFEVTNVGFELLRDVYLGFFVDSDIGPRDHEGYFADDGGALLDLDTTLVLPTPACRDLPVHIRMPYMYDIPDGDIAHGGDADGFFGLLLLGHTTDPTGRTAPVKVGLHTARLWNGTDHYPAGDPANDTERYDLLQSGIITTRPTGMPDDYRFAISTDRFPQLSPGETITLQLAFVVGEGYYDVATNTPHPELGHDGTPNRHTLVANAMRARRAFEGRWKDLDHNPLTGVDGKETCIATAPGQPFVWQDPCDPGHTATFEGSVCSDPDSWVDNDCDPCTPNPYESGCSGGGCETLVHWFVTPAYDLRTPEDLEAPELTTEVGGSPGGTLLRIEAPVNPAAPPVRIRLWTEVAGPCRVRICDVAGRQVRELASTSGGAGVHELIWDGRGDSGEPVGSGIYFVRATASSTGAVERFVILRR